MTSGSKVQVAWFVYGLEEFEISVNFDVGHDHTFENFPGCFN